MRFTIRDILWFTVVIALGVTCCLERHKRLAAQKDAARDRLLLFAENKVTKSLSGELLPLKRLHKSLTESYEKLYRDHLSLTETLKSERAANSRRNSTEDSN